jgi:hypothetical protein
MAARKAKANAALKHRLLHADYLLRMRVFLRCAASVLLSSMLLQGQPAGRIEISGTVTNSATGLPVSGALVALHPGPHQIPEDFNFPKEFNLPESFKLDDASEEIMEVINEKLEKLTAPDPPQRVLSDASGTFSFSVSAGTSGATVEVKRAGFQSRRPVLLPHEKMLSKVNVKLIPLGAVQGRVLNQDGEPVPGVTVDSIQVLVRDGRKEFHDDAHNETNDLGEFRMWDLDPGLVYLEVVDRYGTSPKASDPSLSPSHVAYGPVYYPASDIQAEAQAVRIHPGETIRADFVLQEHKAYKISGVLENPGHVTSIGEPWIRLLRGDDGVPVRSSLDLAKGTFEIVDVPPGSYTIQALGNSEPPVFGETTLTVREGDVSGLVMPLTVVASVKGTVVFPAGPSDPDADPHFAFIQAQATNTERALHGWESDSGQADGSSKFEVKNLLPGNYALSVNASGAYVASIQSGGEDVLSDGLTVGSTAPPEVRIVLAAGGGSLECTVAGLDEESSATVAAVRRYNSTNLVTLGYAGGGFPSHFSNLAPGEYTIFAWPSTREVEYQSPSALAELSAYGVAVSIKEGAHETLALKLIPEEQ